MRLVFLLLLSFAPVLAGARDSRYTRHGTGPKYWIAYEYCYDLNKPMTELRWKNNIDWMAETFRDYGYDMICNDGWIEAAQTVDANGYITKYNSGWVHDFGYWNDYIESKGMKAGIYYNPLWLTRRHHGEADYRLSCFQRRIVLGGCGQTGSRTMGERVCPPFH